MKIPFFRTIRFKLISSFLVSVICIVVLGVASYRTASSSMIKNYKNSSQQTVEMMQQYLDLIISSEKNEYKQYLKDEQFTKYVGNVESLEAHLSTKAKVEGELQGKKALDDKLSAIYLLMDGKDGIYCTQDSISENAYSAYVATPQGAEVAGNDYDWLIYGQNKQADEALGISTNNYAFRIMRKIPTANAVMVLDIDSKFILNAMQSLDPGKGGYVALITSDGKEFYSDQELDSSVIRFFGKDFYAKACESEEQSGNSTAYIDGKEYLFVYSKLPTGGLMAAALIPADTLLKQTNDIKILSIILTLLASAISIILGSMNSNSISKNINYILDKLQKVSRGDLTIKVHSKSKDEFILLCDGLNHTVAHVKHLIQKVNDVSLQLNDAASYVTNAAGTFMETSSDIKNAVSEIEIGVNRLDSGSEDCMNQMDSLSGKIQDVSTNAEEIERLTTTVNGTINSGINSVQGLMDSAQSTSDITKAVISEIGQLEEKTTLINKIISAINNIAEETSLLSVNASIEAARAGDAGKGFAIVAEQIMQLSNQCLDSAAQIAEIVAQIDKQTNAVVTTAMRAEEIVFSQNGAVESTTDAFRQIEKQVEALLRALNTISRNVMDMNTSRTETLDAISGISAVSSETAACSTSVYEAAGTQMDSVNHLNQAALQLGERANELVDILGSFTV